MEDTGTLVVKARDGDIHSFEALVAKYQNMAIGYAYSILKDYQHAEDAAQDSFVQAYFKLGALQSPEAFPSWFRKIVFSQCERFYRKKRIQAIPLDEILEIHDQEQSPSEAVERREAAAKIHKVVNTLPEKERTVTVLFYIDGYSMDEIGNFLSLPISTIKNRLFSARKILKKEMTEIMGGTFRSQKTEEEFTERVKNMIILGHHNTLVVKEDGTVMTWGNLSRYADPKTAGDNAKTMAVAGLKNVKSIATAAGCYGSYALQDDGTVWAWGWNIFRHFGTGSDEEYITTPGKVQNLSDVVSVSAGVSHAVALKEDGSVWTWGKNWYGQLGRGIDTKDGSSFYPAQIPSLKNIKQISSGFFRSFALAEDGTVWRWGGYGDSRVMFPIVYASNIPVQVKIPGKVIAISAGGMHDAMLCEDGTVWTCGYNTQKQLGVNTVANEVLDVPVQVMNMTEVKAISAGGSFTLALKKDGTVWAWGSNEHGELGNGTFDTKIELGIDDHAKNEPVEVSMLQDAVEIAAGGSHAMAVTADGGVWAWGSNDEGQLGDFTDSKRCVPQRIM